MINTVLLITDDDGDADVLHRTLAMARDGPFDVEWVRRLSDGLERLKRGGIDIVLVDFFSPTAKVLRPSMLYSKLFRPSRS